MGWALGVDAEVTGGDGLAYRAVAYPVGVAAVTARGHTVGLTAGLGASGRGGDDALELPVGLDAELQLGPVRLLAWGRIAWLVGAQARAGGAPLGDELHAGAALRLGRDHRYWGTANAGVGPFLGVTVDRAGDATAVGVALGLHLWGGS
ncbi:MAG: hypothetical protein H6709_05465 [Kofleriaceae bacterium]|nr:hypothetical protein [Kofleriaceae bacterium]